MLNDIERSKTTSLHNSVKEEAYSGKFNSPFSWLYIYWIKKSVGKKIKGPDSLCTKIYGSFIVEVSEPIIFLSARLWFTELCSFIIATTFEAGLNIFPVLSTDTKGRLNQNNLNGTFEWVSPGWPLQFPNNI